jgi:hypothetical protein
MLELIGSIVLIYYLVLGVALLVFLALGFLDERRLANRRRCETETETETETGFERPAQYTRESDCDPARQVTQNARLPDNVVRFTLRK